MRASSHSRARITACAGLLALLLAACADLQLAREAYQEGRDENAYRDWSILADKGFPQAHYWLARMAAEGRLGDERRGEAIEHYRAALTAGYPRAAAGLGRFLVRHARTGDERRKAIELLEQAAADGQVDAELALAEVALTGVGADADPQRAVAILTRLSGAGVGEASMRLGAAHEAGIFLDPNDRDAARYYQLAMEQGEPRAAIPLAALYESGRGVPPDVQRAMELLRDLARSGDRTAEYRLAGLLDRQSGPDQQFEARAKYRRLSRGGYMPASKRLADLRLDEGGSADEIEGAIRTLEELSERGYGPASARLGDLYRDGDYRQLDYQQARANYEFALEQGFERAELRIAGLLARGLGMPRDLAAARVIYSGFAALGDAQGAFGLAEVLEAQAPDGPFPVAAVGYYRLAARQQHEGAGLRLATLYLEGLGVERDPQQATAILEALSERGSGSATVRLGDLARDGVLSGETTALEYYRLAVEQGELLGQLRIADTKAASEDPADQEQAAAIYQQLADGGDLPVLYKLARLYEQRLGQGTVTPRIVSLYRRAAEADYPPARIRLADLQLEGLGVPRDRAAAIAVYRDLAARGVGAATFRQGKLYEYGTGVPRNPERAVALYRQARDQGYELADLQLAKLLAAGTGTAQDLATALAIYHRFVQRDEVRALYGLGRLYQRYGQALTPDHRAEAMRWYRQAADQGYTDARYQLALMIEEEGASPESVALFQAAADAGHGRAMLHLGLNVFHGRAVTADQLRGLTLALTATRLQAGGALDHALKLMDLVADPATIPEANDASRQLREALYPQQGPSTPGDPSATEYVERGE